MIDATAAEFCIAYIKVVRASLTGEMMARMHPDRRIDSIDGFFRCYGGYNRKVFSEN